MRASAREEQLRESETFAWRASSIGLDAKAHARHHATMTQWTELEAEIAAGRAEVQALRAEARRMQGESVDRAGSSVVIPAGWLDALASGLAQLVRNYEQIRAAGRISDASREDSDFIDRMRTLAAEIREVEPGCAYTVATGDWEALWSGVLGAWFLQQLQIAITPKQREPPGPRALAIERLRALEHFATALDELMGS
jgi:hypothetical protein